MATQPSQASLSFLSLPPELRNRIYTELVTSNDSIFELYHKHQTPAILCTNQLIRSECSGIFYANAIVTFSDAKLAVNWLSKLDPKHLGLLRELRYDCAALPLSPLRRRAAFYELPGMGEDARLRELREALEASGTVVGEGVLRAGLRVGGEVVWTDNPLVEALEAVKEGRMISRMMFV